MKLTVTFDALESSTMSDYRCQHPLEPSELEAYVNTKSSCGIPFLLHHLPDKVVPTRGPGSREDICIICHDIIHDYELTLEHPACKRCYHADCVHDWWEQSLTCPLCQARLEQSQETILSHLRLPERREAEVRLKIRQQREAPTEEWLSTAGRAHWSFEAMPGLREELHWTRKIIEHLGMEHNIPSITSEEMIRRHRSGECDLHGVEYLSLLWHVIRTLGNVKWYRFQTLECAERAIWMPVLPPIKVMSSIEHLHQEIGVQAFTGLLGQTSTLLRFPFPTLFLANLWCEIAAYSESSTCVPAADLERATGVTHWCLFQKGGDDMVFAVPFPVAMSPPPVSLLEATRVPGLLMRLDKSVLDMGEEFEHMFLLRHLERVQNPAFFDSAKNYARTNDSRPSVAGWNAGQLEASYGLENWTEAFTGPLEPAERSPGRNYGRPEVRRGTM